MFFWDNLVSFYRPNKFIEVLKLDVLNSISIILKYIIQDSHPDIGSELFREVNIVLFQHFIHFDKILNILNLNSIAMHPQQFDLCLNIGENFADILSSAQLITDIL